jgi:probable biosynthetic protein (TIGR04099 family)
MNTLIRSSELAHLLRHGGTSSSLPDVIVLGMPHLSLGGLSETWLLKECGHRHWFQLAAAAGLARPNFRDDAGEPIYAAFLAVSVRDAALDAVREHDELVIASQLARISRTQFTSLHRLSVRTRSIAEVVMTSTFVKRAQKGRNHSIVRVEVSDLAPLAPEPHATAFVAEAAGLRSNRWCTHLGFERSKAAVVDRFVLDPCPGQDFNGADFLYFASFQAFVDRAEWAFFRPDAPFPTTRRRDIVYRGNIDPGEGVVASLLQVRREQGELGHWYRLERAQDNFVIAHVFTLRRLRVSDRRSK